MILDIHTLLWMNRDDPALGVQARQLIEADWRVGQVAVSAINFWEVAMLAERGRIVLPTQLENLHRDPADRFIVATAIDRNTPLMTTDRLILDWAGTLARIPADQ